MYSVLVEVEQIEDEGMCLAEFDEGDPLLSYPPRKYLLLGCDMAVEIAIDFPQRMRLMRNQ